MIHIILAILKIVGILLAVLLGLVLLILLTVLFLPLRYRICAEKHGELKKSTANVSVSWLFGILKVKAGYRNGQISICTEIFGKKIDFAKKNTGQTEVLRKRQKTMKQELRDRKNRGCFGREKATACVRRENETGPRTVSENRNAGKQGFEIRNTGW